MQTVTFDEFCIGTGLTDGEVVIINYANGHSCKATFFEPEVDEGELDYPPITLKDFRNRFLFSLPTLDALEDALDRDDDEKILAICTNIATVDQLEPSKSYLRSTFKTLYSVQWVHIDSQEVKDGMDLLLMVGAINTSTYQAVLDLTTI